MSPSPILTFLGALSLLFLAAACRPLTTGGGGAQPAVNVIPAPENRVGSWSAALSPDGATLAAPCDGAICLWDTSTGEIRTILDKVTKARPVAWSPDGTRLASALLDGSVVLLDPTSGEIIQQMQGHTIPETTDVTLGVTALAFSPDSATVASTAHDGTVRLWRVADGSALRTLKTGGSHPTALAFSPDGQRIAVASTDQPVQLWEVASGRLASTLHGSPPQGYGVAFSPDGRWLATASNDPEKKLHLWDAATLAPVASFPEEVVAHDLAFSPDSATLAFSNRADDSVRLWAVGSGEHRTLAGHASTPHAVRFSPDGTKLYSLSNTEGVLQWDVASGELLRRFELP